MLWSPSICRYFFLTETPSGVVKVLEGMRATSKRTKPWRCISSTTAMIWCDILDHAYFHDIPLRIWQRAYWGLERNAPWHPKIAWPKKIFKYLSFSTTLTWTVLRTSVWRNTYCSQIKVTITLRCCAKMSHSRLHFCAFSAFDHPIEIAKLGRIHSSHSWLTTHVHLSEKIQRCEQHCAKGPSSNLLWLPRSLNNFSFGLLS